MSEKKGVEIEIDKLTNSIVNVISGEIFETEFYKTKQKEIRKKDWLFNWHDELVNKKRQVYKMTTKNNTNIIQGLISFSLEENFIFVHLVESAPFNRGEEKIYEGVGGNLFAYACKISYDKGFDGFVSFISKTSLINYYTKTLGATRTIGQRIIINAKHAEILIKKYFK